MTKTLTYFFIALIISLTVHTPHYPYLLPKGWKWVNITEVTSKITDGTHNSPINLPIGDYKYVTAKNIKTLGVVLDNITYVSKEVHDEIYARCNPEKGDILYIKDGATTGIVTINTLEEPFSLLSSVALIKPIKEISNKFLCYFLQSPLCFASVRDSMKGVGITRITLKQIEQWDVPLPPLAEQHRIVLEIERWFTLIDQIEQDKSDLQTVIKQTKNKILNLAIHGKLVPQDSNDEPAIELLKCINPDFAPCDNGHYPQLPKGWTICQLEQVVEILDNFRKPINTNERNARIANKQEKDLFPYYGATGQVGMIDDFIIDGHYLLLGEDGAPFLDKYAVKAYAITGKCWVNNHAHILAPKIDFEYLIYFLNHVDYSKYVNGSTRLKLTQTDMRSIEILLPPLQEQKRIKSFIQNMFIFLDAIMENL